MKKYIILIAASFVLASLSSYAAVDAKAVWNKYCKKCHGEDGSGKTTLGKKLKIEDYTDAATLKEISDEDLFKATKEGVAKTKMAGYAKKCSDEEIKALVAYIRGMAK